MDPVAIGKSQRGLCREYGVAFVSTDLDEKIGYASSTTGLTPINGLRHRPTTGTSGWYIWCGEVFAEAADFFDPQCAHHFYENIPDAARLLGLPPGYRFLLAGDYLDIWFDESLLGV